MFFKLKTLTVFKLQTVHTMKMWNLAAFNCLLYEGPQGISVHVHGRTLLLLQLLLRRLLWWWGRWHRPHLVRSWGRWGQWHWLLCRSRHEGRRGWCGTSTAMTCNLTCRQRLSLQLPVLLVNLPAGAATADPAMLLQAGCAKAHRAIVVHHGREARHQPTVMALSLPEALRCGNKADLAVEVTDWCDVIPSPLHDTVTP